MKNTVIILLASLVLRVSKVLGMPGLKVEGCFWHA